jgi:hypothetical protein
MRQARAGQEGGRFCSQLFYHTFLHIMYTERYVSAQNCTHVICGLYAAKIPTCIAAWLSEHKSGVFLGQDDVVLPFCKKRGILVLVELEPRIYITTDAHKVLERLSFATVWLHRYLRHVIDLWHQVCHETRGSTFMVLMSLFVLFTPCVVSGIIGEGGRLLCGVFGTFVIERVSTRTRCMQSPDRVA